MRRFFGVVLILGVFLSGGASGHARGIELSGGVLESLNGVLETTVELHQAMFGRDELAIAEALDGLLERVNEVRRSLSEMPPHDRQHLELIINSVRNQVERSQITYGMDRREHLRETFYQLAHMTRIYSLDPKYNVFFCAKDRSHWVQSGRGVARNPVNPDTLERCGKIVR